MMDGLPVSVFGPEYHNYQTVDLGVFEVPAGPAIDVMIGYLTILPVGGYIIRYVAGEYTLVGSGKESWVGGKDGLHIKWHTQSGDWVTTEFPNVPVGKYKFAAGWNVEDLVYCELTEPGRIVLVPPADLHGTVSLRIIQAIPQHASISYQSY